MPVVVCSGASGLVGICIQFRSAVMSIQVLTGLLCHGNHGTNRDATSPSELSLDEGPVLRF